MTAQDRYNKTIATRKRLARNFKPYMDGIAKSLATLREGSIYLGKRPQYRTFKKVFKEKAKSAKRTSELVF